VDGELVIGADGDDDDNTLLLLNPSSLCAASFKSEKKPSHLTANMSTCPRLSRSYFYQSRRMIIITFTDTNGFRKPTVVEMIAASDGYRSLSRYDLFNLYYRVLRGVCGSESSITSAAVLIVSISLSGKLNCLRLTAAATLYLSEQIHRPSGPIFYDVLLLLLISFFSPTFLEGYVFSSHEI
jgi:hypothetical protein